MCKVFQGIVVSICVLAPSFSAAQAPTPTEKSEWEKSYDQSVTEYEEMLKPLTEPARALFQEKYGFDPEAKLTEKSRDTKRDGAEKQKDRGATDSTAAAEAGFMVDDSFLKDFSSDLGTLLKGSIGIIGTMAEEEARAGNRVETGRSAKSFTGDGTVLMLTGQLDKAIEQFQNAIKTDPTYGGHTTPLPAR
jgi:tetratricopeptide (TPR) repeat protein